MTTKDIEWEIHYEENPPEVATVHPCACGQSCRRDRCADCWRKELQSLEEKAKAVKVPIPEIPE